MPEREEAGQPQRYCRNCGAEIRPENSFSKKAGLSGDVSPYWLRHSPVTYAKRRGADLDFIMRTLRHASLATAGRYLHADPSDSFAMYLGL